MPRRISLRAELKHCAGSIISGAVNNFCFSVPILCIRFGRNGIRTDHFRITISISPLNYRKREDCLFSKAGRSFPTVTYWFIRMKFPFPEWFFPPYARFFFTNTVFLLAGVVQALRVFLFCLSGVLHMDRKRNRITGTGGCPLDNRIYPPPGKGKNEKVIFPALVRIL